MEIPAEELQSITLALSDALDSAADGRQTQGYALLVRGLLRAERLCHDGAPWTIDLLRRWREAIDRYCDHIDRDENSESGSDAEPSQHRG